MGSAPSTPSAVTNANVVKNAAARPWYNLAGRASNALTRKKVENVVAPMTPATMNSRPANMPVQPPANMPVQPPANMNARPANMNARPANASQVMGGGRRSKRKSKKRTTKKKGSKRR